MEKGGCVSRKKRAGGKAKIEMSASYQREKEKAARGSEEVE